MTSSEVFAAGSYRNVVVPLPSRSRRSCCRRRRRHRVCLRAVGEVLLGELPHAVVGVVDRLAARLIDSVRLPSGS